MFHSPWDTPSSLVHRPSSSSPASPVSHEESPVFGSCGNGGGHASLQLQPMLIDAPWIFVLVLRGFIHCVSTPRMLFHAFPAQSNPSLTQHLSKRHILYPASYTKRSRYLVVVFVRLNLKSPETRETFIGSFALVPNSLPSHSGGPVASAWKWRNSLTAPRRGRREKPHNTMEQPHFLEKSSLTPYDTIIYFVSVVKRQVNGRVLS